MKLPIKIDSTTAQQISYWITNRGRTRHLLKERKKRIEMAANRELNDIKEFREYFTDYLTGADIYFSYLKISPFHSTPLNIDSISGKKVMNFLKEARQIIREIKSNLTIDIKIPVQLIGHKIKQTSFKEKTYIYCIKEKNVLVLVGDIKGNLSPRSFADFWHLSFAFKGITFLNFDNTTDYITSTIIKNKNLLQYNALLSWLFPLFKVQAREIADHYIEEEIDKKALELLSNEDEELLWIYLPIFDRYGDADNRILELCDLILKYYEYKYPDLPQWIITSPSYSLPIWFRDFFNSLNPTNQNFLRKLDLNSWTDDELLRIIALLKDFMKVKRITIESPS